MSILFLIGVVVCCGAWPGAKTSVTSMRAPQHGQGAPIPLAIKAIQTFDPNTGLLTGITAGRAGAVKSYSYTYHTLGKLLTHGDANTGLGETFGYDSLNRLTSSSV